MSEIKIFPCPFCGEKLSNIEKFPMLYQHPSNDCFFSELVVKQDQIDKWNTRKPMEYILKRFSQIEELDSVAHIKDSREETLTNGYVKGIKKAIEICKEAGGIE